MSDKSGDKKDYTSEINNHEPITSDDVAVSGDDEGMVIEADGQQVDADKDDLKMDETATVPDGMFVAQDEDLMAEENRSEKVVSPGEEGIVEGDEEAVELHEVSKHTMNENDSDDDLDLLGDVESDEDVDHGDILPEGATVKEMSEANDEANDIDKELTVEERAKVKAMIGESDVSDAEDGNDTNDQEGEVQQLYAMPPSRQMHTDEHVEVSNSPAFQCLEDLFQSGKLSGTEVAQFKAKYLTLFNVLQKSRENEFHMLQKAKAYTAKMEQQQAEIGVADQFPDNVTTEVGRLREQVLKHSNEILQAQDRNYTMEYKLKCLQEEKRILEREYQRMPKSEEIEEMRKRMEQGNKQLHIDIDKEKRESRKLKEKGKDLESEKAIVEKRYDEIQAKYSVLQAEYNEVNSKPNQIAKEADRLTDEMEKNERLAKELDDEIQSSREAVGKVQLGQLEIQKDDEKQKNLLNVQFMKLAKKEAELEQITGRHDELVKATEKLKSDKATLKKNIDQLSAERQSQYDVSLKRARDKEREERNLKEAHKQLRSAEDALAVTRAAYDKIKDAFDTAPRLDDIATRKKQLESEVEQLKRMKDNQSSLTAAEQVKIHQMVNEEEQLLFELSDLRCEVTELQRLANIKAEEREKKARDYMKAELQHQRVIESLKAKELQIGDHDKKHKENQAKLTRCSKQYDIIKNERSKYSNQFQLTTQKASEMREKLRILQNEIEILRTGLQQKDKMLLTQRLKHANMIVMRDALRSELSKQQAIERSSAKVREQLQMDIQRLNATVNQAEEQMVTLRGQSDKAVQNRNDRGVQLIERNEEVCILQEKIRVQQDLISRGEREMKDREEEIALLRRFKRDEERKLALLRKNLPTRSILENELTTLQIQLSTCQDRMFALEAECENADEDAGRLRLLEGADPQPAELQTKLETVERRLATKEEQALEKELLLEAVGRLSDQMRSKAVVGKDDTLCLAKEVNNFKSQMNTATKKMKATTAELTMHMATAMKLQQEIKEKETQIEQCYRRMENGEAPSEEMEREWTRALQARERRARQREFEGGADGGGAEGESAGGAEARPNAYIPDEELDELPIPRPYGAHAPFRPVEPGANMRHIRKPKLKPIEI